MEYPEEATDYTIDADNLIKSVGGAWEEFARMNDAPHLSAVGVLGRNLLAFVSGPEATHLYELLLLRVRRTRATVRFPFRCDSPRLRRFMELEIRPLEQGCLGFAAVLLREEPRAPVDLLGPGRPASETFLRICSWCKRVAVRGDWEEIEDAVAATRPFLRDQLPQLTHGICPPCHDAVLAELGRAIPRSPPPPRTTH